MIRSGTASTRLTPTRRRQLRDQLFSSHADPIEGKVLFGNDDGEKDSAVSSSRSGRSSPGEDISDLMDTTRDRTFAERYPVRVQVPPSKANPIMLSEDEDKRPKKHKVEISPPSEELSCFAQFLECLGVRRWILSRLGVTDSDISAMMSERLRKWEEEEKRIAEEERRRDPLGFGKQEKIENSRKIDEVLKNMTWKSKQELQRLESLRMRAVGESDSLAVMRISRSIVELYGHILREADIKQQMIDDVLPSSNLLDGTSFAGGFHRSRL